MDSSQFLGRLRISDLPPLNVEPMYKAIAFPLSNSIPHFSNCSALTTVRSSYWLRFHRREVAFDAILFGQRSFSCLSKGSGLVHGLEMGKSDDRNKSEDNLSGIYWILLLNLCAFIADHFLQIPAMKKLYLYHNWPAWFQFFTSIFCHANWNHLSSNLFFLYIFGKLIEEEEGSFGVWMSYIVTGTGANLVSWVFLPRNSVSIGASGAVFGMFIISVLVKVCWKCRMLITWHISRVLLWVPSWYGFFVKFLSHRDMA